MTSPTATSAAVPSTEARASRPGHRALVASAWAVPVLVIGQFALLAVVPVVVVLVGTLRDARLRPLRRWAGALAAAYATPLVLWALGPDRAASLSKDMSPVLAAVVVVAACAYAVALHLSRRRRRG